MYGGTPLAKKQAIITEYLCGNLSLRQIGRKYNIDHKTIHHWVMKHEGKKPSKKADSETEAENTELPSDIKQLQEELRKAKLQNKLLNAIIDIAERELKVDIRKKSGTKR